MSVPPRQLTGSARGCAWEIGGCEGRTMGDGTAHFSSCPLAYEFSCKAAALCGVCSAFGAQNVFLLHPN